MIFGGQVCVTAFGVNETITTMISGKIMRNVTSASAT